MILKLGHDEIMESDLKDLEDISKFDNDIVDCRPWLNALPYVDISKFDNDIVECRPGLNPFPYVDISKFDNDIFEC